MKKSLSLILAIAMVFSMFASVAFAAEATTTDTPKTTEEKYDALKALGIFEGDETGANLEGDMTRAQLAKIVAKLLKVEENKAANTYTDVPADHWAAGFIGAATEAKAFDGVAPGKFDPEGKVSYQQLATVLVRLTGLAQSTDEVTGKVDDWAKGYVAVAVKELGLTQADYTVNATRGVFVELTFAALPKVVIPGKVSVVEAKGTGVQSVEVKFNKAVDTAAAKLELKKGAVVIPTTTKFTDSKDSAVLTITDLKLNEGTYTVTLSGLAADVVDKTTATFTAENEKVEKIDFVSTSDTVAQSDTVKIKLAATNQYGEKASANAGSYTAYSTTPGGARITKNDSGDLYIIVDTDDKTLTANLSSFSVNIYNNDSRVSASKTFKVGLPPMVSKVEFGKITYKNNKDALTSAGDKAVLELVQIDQYGQEIDLQTGNAFPVNLQVTPNFNNQFTPSLADDDNDNAQEVVITMNSKATVTGEQTVTAFGGGSTATAKIAVKAVAVPAKVEFGELTGSYADGDTDKYVTLNLYDAEGNLLSADDIVDNVDRLTISASGNIAFGPTDDVPAATFATKMVNNVPTTTPIIAVGPNKGKIHLKSLTGKGTANIFVYTNIIESGVTSNANLNLPITEARYPVTMTVATDPATKAIVDAETKVKLLVKDQYNETLKKLPYGVVTENNGSRTVTYDVYVKSSKTGTNTEVAFNLADGYYDINAISDKEYKFNAKAVDTSKTVTFALRKLEASVLDGAVVKGNVIDENVKTITKEVTVLNPANSNVKLTYSVGTVGDLFNAIDNKVLSTNDDDPVTSKHAKNISITAKDSSGTNVAVPNTVISVTSDNENVALGGVDAKKAYVIGNKVGTANVSVSYRTANNNIENKVVAVTVKNDPISVASIKADKTTHIVKPFSSTLAYRLFNTLEVKDQYGSTYKSETTTETVSDVKKIKELKDVVYDYNKLLGIQYLISEVKGGGTVELETDGRTVKVNGQVNSFVIQAVSPNGKIATTQVVVSSSGTDVTLQVGEEVK